MENKSSTRAQEAQNSRLIHLEGSFEDWVLDFIAAEGFTLTDNQQEASQTYKINDGRLFFDTHSSGPNLFSSGIPLNKNNLKCLINFHKLSRNKEAHNLGKIKDLKLNLTNQQRRLVKTIFKKHLTPTGLDEVIKTSEEIREIDDFYSHFDSIHSLPRSIIEMDLFKGFESCQVIVHQKGKMFCDTYYYVSGLGDQHKVIPVESFNSTFSLIKKSKSKKFNQSKLLKEDIGILGTFMANVFSIKNHDIVFIVSQNGFLPPTKEEINLFDTFCSRIGSVFDFLLQRNEVSEKSQNVNILLMNYPHPVAILTSKDQILFRNRLFDEEVFYEFLDTPDRFQTWKLIKDHLLVSRIPDSTKNISDIYHYQRVSLLGELLNTLQHELSNPLFGLKLTAELLEMEHEDEEVKETLSEIASNGQRCLGIIKNFSYLYQDENFTDNVEIIRLIQETVILTKSESRQVQKLITHDGLPEDFTIQTNPTWLSQILFNLIVNSSQAIKTITDDFRPHQIHIDISKSDRDLNISVSDSGPGIPDGSLADVFSPFYTTKDKGTGLGLSICNNLCLKLGGRLNYSKSPLGGACFTLSIPLEKVTHDQNTTH
ncbi:MAG: HAMP domain-containing histidine kinase [Deltaproteobacteria bacterium]|nr:MAG: HAMP domain-containing histidine kinase [Deltaproteobacteria bacterium]